MTFYDDIQHIINSSEEIQEEFIDTIIKPIYRYTGNYHDILNELKFLPESSLSRFIVSFVHRFIIEHNLRKAETLLTSMLYVDEVKITIGNFKPSDAYKIMCLLLFPSDQYPGLDINTKTRDTTRLGNTTRYIDISPNDMVDFLDSDAWKHLYKSMEKYIQNQDYEIKIMKNEGVSLIEYKRFDDLFKREDLEELYTLLSQ